MMQDPEYTTSKLDKTEEEAKKALQKNLYDQMMKSKRELIAAKANISKLKDQLKSTQNAQV